MAPFDFENRLHPTPPTPATSASKLADFLDGQEKPKVATAPKPNSNYFVGQPHWRPLYSDFECGAKVPLLRLNLATRLKRQPAPTPYLLHSHLSLYLFLTAKV